MFDRVLNTGIYKKIYLCDNFFFVRYLNEYYLPILSIFSFKNSS